LGGCEGEVGSIAGFNPCRAQAGDTVIFARLLGKPDRETLNQVVAIYDHLDVAWGRVHARIAQGLIEPDEASHQLHRVHRAWKIAQASGLLIEVALIEGLPHTTKAELMLRRSPKNACKAS